MTMGKISETIKITNFIDEKSTQRGELEKEAVRSVEVEAIADSGATMLCLKQSLIQQLGLPLAGERRARTTNGVVTRRIYDGAQMTLKERTAVFDVVEVPDDCPNLIGYIPLERLDFVLNLQGQKIIPNPEHDGEFQIEMYFVS
jgi:predicted aspartyl protease